MDTRSYLLTALLAATLLVGCRVIPGESATATPQRPRFSANTSTTHEGTVEFEGGAEWDPSDRFALPVVFKYGAGERTEVFVGLPSFLALDGAGGNETGVGDASVGVRHRFREESEYSPSLAYQASVKLPFTDASQGLGTGEIDVSIAGIATKNIARFTVVGYWQLDLLGDPGGGTELGHSVAFAGGYRLRDDLSAFAEIAGVFVPESDLESVFTTLGAAFSITPWAVADAGIVVGLSSDAPDFAFVVGYTRNLGRVEGLD